MEVKRGEPLEVLRVVLEQLERQAIKAGSHPVLIHEGLGALDRLREENARLREEMKHNDPASYSSMVYWREKCYEARAKLARVVEVCEDVRAKSDDAGMIALALTLLAAAKEE